MKQFTSIAVYTRQKGQTSDKPNTTFSCFIYLFFFDPGSHGLQAKDFLELLIWTSASCVLGLQAHAIVPNEVLGLMHGRQVLFYGAMSPS